MVQWALIANGPPMDQDFGPLDQWSIGPIGPLVQWTKILQSFTKLCSSYPVTSVSNDGVERQFPMKLAWSITIHISQGLTFKFCWIDPGPSEKAAGLTYVTLSRVPWLSNLVIEPMSFDRLHSVKKTSNYKYRLVEEARLEALAKQIVTNYRKTCSEM